MLGSDRKFRRFSLSYMPTPPCSSRHLQSSALAAHAQKKVDSNDRALLKFNMFTAKRARQLRKQVGRLRPDQAAPRWLSLCSPRPGKKRIQASSHARADEIRRVIILERLNHSRQRQSDPKLINNKAFTSTEASKARDRVDFGFTHRKDFFL